MGRPAHRFGETAVAATASGRVSHFRTHGEQIVSVVLKGDDELISLIGKGPLVLFPGCSRGLLRCAVTLYTLRTVTWVTSVVRESPFASCLGLSWSRIGRPDKAAVADGTISVTTIAHAGCRMEACLALAATTIPFWHRECNANTKIGRCDQERVLWHWQQFFAYPHHDTLRSRQ